MSFMIIAYNPAYVKLANLEKLVELINKKESVPVYLIEHTDDAAFPVYAVRQFDEQDEP